MNPVEEREVSDSPYRFEGGDAAIIAQVQKEPERERGEIIEVDSSESEEDKLEEKGVTISKVMKMCEDLECLSLCYGSADTSLTLTRELHQFHIHFTRGIENFSAKENFRRIIKVSHFYLIFSWNKNYTKLNILIEFYQSFQAHTGFH